MGAAIVTGGGRGIGRAIAARLAADGWAVVIGDIDEPTATATAREIGDAAVGCRLDVTDPVSADAVVEATRKRCGSVDLLVNNAGLIHVGPLLELPLVEWQKLFAVNVEGCLTMMQAAARAMREQPASDSGVRGRIVNIGSPAAEAPRPLLAAYGASKAAIKHLSRSASVALEADGVWVTVVYPTNVEDGMWRSLPDQIGGASGRDRDDVIAERLATAPTGRFQTAEEVAGMVAYAATAPAVNGKLLWTEAHVVDL